MTTQPTTTPRQPADELHAAAHRALSSLEDLIAELHDPGVEALGARYELARALGTLSPKELPLDEPGFSPDPHTIREATLRQAAHDLTAHCPDHGTADTCFIACQCLAADDLRKQADTIREASGSGGSRAQDGGAQ